MVTSFDETDEAPRQAPMLDPWQRSSNTPEPRLRVVQVYDKSLGAVEKALRTGEQGLNPANDAL